MKETPKNIAASIQARLKNESVQQGKPFAEILQYYAMERFLYRLSKSEYANKFILKGGLIFYAWDIPLRRPTKDIDFRSYVGNSRKNVIQVVKNITSGSVPEDGVSFDPKTITAEETQIDADYEGIRVRFVGHLGKSKIPMQLDIGFSDEITSKAEPVEYPGLLSGEKKIRIKGYPKESVISEKFHAMVRHAELNSRMKDYYDIWLISESFEFESSALQNAIKATFKKRETELPMERPVALTVEFASANGTRWENFLKKINLENSDVDDFMTVIEKIWKFLEYPLQSSIDKTKSDRNWIPHKGWK